MKKFFGILLIIIGSLWALVFLLTFSAEDGAAIFASVFLTAIGVGIIILGAALCKSKSKTKQPTPQPNTAYVPPQQTPPQPQQANAPLTLKEIRQLTEQKIENSPPSVGLVSALELGKKLYSLNDARLPFEFQGSNQNGVDMLAHWKMADVNYLGMLGLSKHDIQAQFDVLMKFDEQNRILRCKDKIYQKQSSFGVGGMGMEMSTFSGKSKSVQKEIVFGRKKDGSIGKVADISLDTTILQNAIKAVAEKNGWTVKRVAGKL